MYLIFYLIFIYSLFYNVELLPEECIADYLLLSKNVKTELFANIIQEKYAINTWVVLRGIPKNEALKYEVIFKSDIEKFMGKEYANSCFELNEKLTFLQQGLLLDINELFTEEKTHLILSKNITELLDQQSTCLKKFLNENFYKTYDNTNLKIISQITNYNDKIINFEFIKRIEHNSKSYIYNWNIESSEILNKKYEKGTKKYNQLEECNNILTYNTKNVFITRIFPFLQTKNYQNFCYETTNSGKYIHLKQIFSHFNLNQFYLKKLPYNVYYVKNIEADDSKPECSVCLEVVKVEDKAKQLIPCNHIFHEKCIQSWLNKNPTCPSCRQAIIIQNASEVESTITNLNNN